jgi:hypothetical protein
VDTKTYVLCIPNCHVPSFLHRHLLPQLCSDPSIPLLLTLHSTPSPNFQTLLSHLADFAVLYWLYFFHHTHIFPCVSPLHTRRCSTHVLHLKTLSQSVHNEKEDINKSLFLVCVFALLLPSIAYMQCIACRTRSWCSNTAQENIQIPGEG